MFLYYLRLHKTLQQNITNSERLCAPVYFTGGDFSTDSSSMLPEFFLLHSMIDAMWDYYQHHYPNHSKKWLADRKRRIVWYNLPRFWYVDNTNLGRCGLKIKYENIFPKKVSMVTETSKISERRGSQ